MKKTFKDYLQQDISNVFINTNEFADLHELDGIQMYILVDEDSFNEFSGTAEQENAMQGIYQSAITIYVKSSDYKKPEIGDRLKLDDDYYYVTGAYDSAGLLKINLVSNEIR